MNRYEDEKKNILLSLRLLRRTDFTFLRYIKLAIGLEEEG